MKFGAVRTVDAEGSVLAHSLTLANGTRLRKGLKLGVHHIDALKESAIESVIVATFQDGDVAEDEAASVIAKAAAGQLIRVADPFTGRANLFSEAAGVLTVNQTAIHQLNSVDPGITLATLPAFARVEEGRMVATAKIIPFAVSQEALSGAVEGLSDDAPLSVKPFTKKRVAYLSTVLSGTKPSVVQKTRRVLEGRLAGTGAAISYAVESSHSVTELADQISGAISESDILLIFGASAICDEEDIIPSAIRAAGGRIEHFGMPVDPGNLMLIGDVGGKPVIGAPGCARSPAVNGFDWVLDRFLASIPVVKHDIIQMGVGGLLMEIVTRPQPRSGELPEDAGHYAAIVLAAGRSSRMGSDHKLLLDFKGEPLITHAVKAAISSEAHPVIVVTGHLHDEIASALRGLDVQLVHNKDHAAGMASSLVTGLNGVPATAKGVIVHLGDMPLVTQDDINALIHQVRDDADALIGTVSHNGKRGNPVLFHRRLFDDLKELTGDTGAKAIINKSPDLVRDVALGEGVIFDVDTPEKYQVLLKIDS